MRGISKGDLIDIDPWQYDNPQELLNGIIAKCQELQEPWIPLEEFLKSGFVGQCWVHAMNGEILIAYFSEHGFIWALGGLDKDKLTHVAPIHKPEPPR